MEGKFCGFVWFVMPKVIINIKKLAIAKNRNQAEVTQSTENKKDNKGEDEDEEIEQENNEPKVEDEDEVIWSGHTHHLTHTVFQIFC